MKQKQEQNSLTQKDENTTNGYRKINPEGMK
jgi:hypothetical protein